MFVHPRFMVASSMMAHFTIGGIREIGGIARMELPLFPKMRD